MCRTPTVSEIPQPQEEEPCPFQLTALRSQLLALVNGCKAEPASHVLRQDRIYFLHLAVQRFRKEYSSRDISLL